MTIKKLSLVVFALAVSAVRGSPPLCPQELVRASAITADPVLAYYRSTMKEQQITFLREFVGIASISEDAAFRKELNRAAEFTAQTLRDAGMEHVSIDDSRDDTHVPVVYAESPLVPGAPYVIIYGHFDVSPALNQTWLTDPFVLTEVGGRLFGRGIVDDKGGIAANIFALTAFMKKNGKLPVNARIVFEGGEESGTSLSNYFAHYKSRFNNVKTVLITDGMNRRPGFPVLEIASRGHMRFKISITPSAGFQSKNLVENPTHRKVILSVTSGKNALHSGTIAGGAVPNPLVELARLVSNLPRAGGLGEVQSNGASGQAPSSAQLVISYPGGQAALEKDVWGLNVRHGLVWQVQSTNNAAAVDPNPAALGEFLRLLAGLVDERQRLAVPGFYDGIIQPEFPLSWSPTEAEFKEMAEMLPGVQLVGDPNLSPQFKVARLPAFNIGRIDRFGNEVHATVSVRLVPGMDGRKVAANFAAYVHQLAKPNFIVKFSDHSGISLPDRQDPFSLMMQLGFHSLATAFGQPPILAEDGGTLPLISHLRSGLGEIDILIDAVGGAEGHVHAENESMAIADLVAATEAKILLLQSIADSAAR
jgi:acetylornithine deacetylase/succinyl-diaminopimelate desuccinylase-like protein